MSASPPRRPRVLIVGLVDTGLLCAVRLARHADVTAVSTKPCMLSGQELGLRLARPQAWRTASVIDFDRYRGLAGVDILHGRATTVDVEARVLDAETATGEHRRLPYDVLLLATGVRNGFWRNGRVESRAVLEADLDRRAARMAAASRLVVVGGGPSGVSAAGNARRQRPQQAVHLYFSQELPLPGYHPKTRQEVAQHLRELGVHLHPHHRAVVPPEADEEAMSPGPVHWQTGQSPSEADLVLWTLGRVLSLIHISEPTRPY